MTEHIGKSPEEKDIITGRIIPGFDRETVVNYLGQFGSGEIELEANDISPLLEAIISRVFDVASQQFSVDFGERKNLLKINGDSAIIEIHQSVSKKVLFIKGSADLVISIHLKNFDDSNIALGEIKITHVVTGGPEDKVNSEVDEAKLDIEKYIKQDLGDPGTKLKREIEQYLNANQAVMKRYQIALNFKNDKLAVAFDQKIGEKFSAENNVDYQAIGEEDNLEFDESDTTINSEDLNEKFNKGNESSTTHDKKEKTITGRGARLRKALQNIFPELSEKLEDTIVVFDGDLDEEDFEILIEGLKKLNIDLSPDEHARLIEEVVSADEDGVFTFDEWMKVAKALIQAKEVSGAVVAYAKLIFVAAMIALVGKNKDSIVEAKNKIEEALGDFVTPDEINHIKLMLVNKVEDGKITGDEFADLLQTIKSAATSGATINERESTLDTSDEEKPHIAEPNTNDLPTNADSVGEPDRIAELMSRPEKLKSLILMENEGENVIRLYQVLYGIIEASPKQQQLVSELIDRNVERHLMVLLKLEMEDNEEAKEILALLEQKG